LIIVNSNHNNIKKEKIYFDNIPIYVLILDTQYKREQGLQYTRILNNEGALFSNQQNELQYSFTSENLLQNIDVALINEQGKILQIFTLCSSKIEIKNIKIKYFYALEMPEHWFSINGFSIGDIISIVNDSNQSLTLQFKKMHEHFITRLKKHIELVNYYANILKNKYNIEIKNIEKHDINKFEYPLLIPYVYITWKYYCIRNSIEYNFSNHIKNDMNEVTIKHITTNHHHPEFWDPNFDEQKFNTSNRDGIPNKIVDATKMPDMYIAEMICDWSAVSKEKNSNIINWADTNINTRWKFNNDQIKLIYDLIEKLKM